MGNIKNYTFDKLDFRLSNSEYWDFYLNTDAIKNSAHYSTNNIASFNFSGYTFLSNNSDFDFEDFLSSDFETVGGITSETQWSGYTSPVSGFTATTFGLTSLDNGYSIYDESTDDDAHNSLLSALTGTSLIHTSGDTKLHLKAVSGLTGSYVYPLSLVTTTGSTGNYVNLCGGFFQGHYKIDGWDYQTLPTRYEKGFTISTWLNPTTGCTSGFTATTLNDTYPDNKGFFFYTGTRAENKFWNIFTGNTFTACTSADTSGATWCMDIKETEININNIYVGDDLTDLSVPLSPPPVDVKRIKNQFLIYGRSQGLTCSNSDSSDGYGTIRAGTGYDKTTPYYSSIIRQETVNFLNPFLIFGRSQGLTCGNGQSEDNYGKTRAGRGYSGLTQDVMELDKDADIIDNAIGFRIKDDGSIGYRLLTVSADCKTVEMVEEYSASGQVTSDQWSMITVKWVNNDEYSECDLVHSDPRKGKFKFYVNCNLIFVSKELNEFIPKRLADLQEKQIGVPYNVSIGGGTQGLLESITFDGQDAADLGLVIEQNFAGSFIGNMSNFDLFDKNLSWCEIKDIYKSRRLNFI
jgi:hypothetical protein